jgi:hypothetical protein
MSESRGCYLNPNDQGGGEPRPNIETKVNTLQSQICDISSVLQNLTRTLDRLVDKDRDMNDSRSEYSDYRTVDRVSEHDDHMHASPSDANQSQFLAFDSRTQTYPQNVLGRDRPTNFPYRPNNENQIPTR